MRTARTTRNCHLWGLHDRNCPDIFISGSGHNHAYDDDRKNDVTGHKSWCHFASANKIAPPTFWCSKIKLCFAHRYLLTYCNFKLLILKIGVFEIGSLKCYLLLKIFSKFLQDVSPMIGNNFPVKVITENFGTKYTTILPNSPNEKI